MKLIGKIGLPLALLAATACKPRLAGSPTPAPAPAIPAGTAPPETRFATMAGKPMYRMLCAPCHGPEGRGYAADHAPSLVNKTFLASATDEFLHRSIVTGRPGTSMGAYGDQLGGPLNDAAVDRLVAHLRAYGPAAGALTAAGRGDAARGAALYTAGCKSCHGDASSRGEAVHLANAQFLAQATDAFIRHAIVHGRPETKMEPFAGKLTDSQIDDVVAFVRALGSQAAAVKLLPAPTGKESLVLNPHGQDPTFVIQNDRFVSVEQVNRALTEKRRMIIIDARPPSEWMRVHVKGAVSIPYHDMKRLAEVPRDVWAIAYCACPHHLSGDVVSELIRLGHKRALILDEGINEWHRRRYPVVAAEGVSPPAAEPAPAPVRVPVPLPVH